MQVLPFESRSNWRTKVAQLGYKVELLEKPIYWMEAAARPLFVSFTPADVDALAKATSHICALVNRTIEQSISASKFSDLAIPPFFVESVVASWKRHDPSLIGRLDFAYSNPQTIKLLELNFDTPTSMYESAELQDDWLVQCKQDGIVPSDAEQANDLRKMLQQTLGDLIPHDELLHLGTFGHATEEFENLRFIEKCAVAAGLQAKLVDFAKLKRDVSGRIFDLDGRPLRNLFKLYPWELLLLDDQEFFENTGARIFEPLIREDQLRMFEPAWKCMVTSKAFLQLLYEAAQEDQYILPASMDNDTELAMQIRSKPHARKPIFGRQGQGVVLVETPQQTQRGVLLQERAALPLYEGYYFVVSCWVVGGKFAGISVRADQSAVTGRNALFVPHCVLA